jgi:hypothetical protein
MRRVIAITALVAMAVVSLGLGAAPAPAATSGASRIAPIVMRTLGDAAAQPVVASDNALHALYELAIVNTRNVPVAIDKIEVRTVDPRLVIGPAFEGPSLVSSLRHVDGSPLTEAVIAPGEQVFMFVDVGLFAAIELPVLVDHRVTIGDRQFNLATVNIDAAQAVGVNSPVQGRNWVVMEGCCGPDSVDRTTVYATEAGYSTPGRFAIDLAQMDDKNRLVTDDPSQLTSYPSYGQYANAISAGRVVSVVDGLPDQVPGAPDPSSSFDEDTAQGNSVVVELGSGQYAFYGGLEPGSIIVKEGSFVRKGQPLAQIGNSADGLEPHLHFEVLDSPERIGAQGRPFVFNSFAYAGHIDPGKLFARGLAGPFSDSRLPVTQVRTAQLPLALSILDFESASGSSGNPLL